MSFPPDAGMIFSRTRCFADSLALCLRMRLSRCICEGAKREKNGKIRRKSDVLLTFLCFSALFCRKYRDESITRSSDFRRLLHRKYAFGAQTNLPIFSASFRGKTRATNKDPSRVPHFYPKQEMPEPRADSMFIKNRIRETKEIGCGRGVGALGILSFPFAPLARRCCYLLCFAWIALAVQALGLLVSLNSTHYCASIRDLSNS